MSELNLYTPNILELAEEAAERAGYDMTSGSALRSAKTSLDLLDIEWGNEGLNLWRLDSQTLTLQPGVSEYVLPLDTLDIVQGASIRTVDVYSNRDIPIARFDYADYASIVDKSRLDKPHTVFYRKIVTPSIVLYPVPDKVYTFVYWRLRRAQSVGYTAIPDAASPFIPALVAGMAYKMALKAKKKDYNLITILKADYEQLFTQAKYADVDRSPIYLSPVKGW